MKKMYLLILVTGSCYVAPAQVSNPTDTLQRYSSNNPDSVKFNNTNANFKRPNMQDTTSPYITRVDTMSNSNLKDTMDLSNRSNADSMNNNNNNAAYTTDSMNNSRVYITDSMSNNSGAYTTDSMDNNNNAGSMNNAKSTTPSSDMNKSSTPALVYNTGKALSGINKWAALPVLNSWVQQDIVDKIKSQYGDKLYDITRLKVSEGKYNYSARTQESGVYTAVIVNDNDVTSNIKQP